MRKFIFHALWRYRCVAVGQADRESCSGCPVGRVDGTAASPGDVVGGEITRVGDVIVAQIPLAAVTAVVTAGHRVDGILEPVAFDQCITRLAHVDTGTGNAVVQVVIHVRPTAALQWQTRIYVAVNIVVESDLAATGNIGTA